MTSSREQEGHTQPGYFVGRDRELTELRAALDELYGRGRILLISGEPGIGKTRLADELARRLGVAGFKSFRDDVGITVVSLPIGPSSRLRVHVSDRFSLSVAANS